MDALQMMMAAAGEITWENWDELSESGLASDDIFVCLMSNVNAGGDETGEGGGLTGADLVLTEAGTLAGATGAPPTRDFDGTDDVLSMTTAAADALFGNANNTWTIILKVTNLDLVTQDIFWKFDNSGATENIYCIQQADKIPDFTIEQDNVIEIETETDALQAATTYYICLWTDGTVARCGYSTTKPTKWSDFAAGKRSEFSTNTGAFSGETFDANSSLMGLSAAGFCGGELYYVVIAKTCLIDNDS